MSVNFRWVNEACCSAVTVSYRSVSASFIRTCKRVLTCSEGDEGRGIDPSSFRCLLVSFASWLV